MPDIKNTPTPIEDEILEVLDDPLQKEKMQEVARIKAERTISLFEPLIPLTYFQETDIGTVSITIHAVNNRVANRPLDGAIGFDISVDLDGTPVEVDGRREFINPPLRFVTSDGENETVMMGEDGETPERSYRWREDSVSCLLRDIGEQIKSELTERS